MKRRVSLADDAFANLWRDMHVMKKGIATLPTCNQLLAPIRVQLAAIDADAMELEEHIGNEECQLVKLEKEVNDGNDMLNDLMARDKTHNVEEVFLHNEIRGMTTLILSASYEMVGGI